MLIVTVIRDIWDPLWKIPSGIARGGLLSRTGAMSVLGFYLETLGVPKEELKGWALPFHLARKYDLPSSTGLHDIGWVDAVLRADSEANETALKILFDTVGVELRFADWMDGRIVCS